MLSSTHMNASQQAQYDNPFASMHSENDPFQSPSAYVEPDLDLTGQSTTKASKPSVQPLSSPNPFANPLLSGNIGSSARPAQQEQQQQTQSSFVYTGEDTLDEPVSVTILRDLKQVAGKLKQVLHPKGDRNVLRDWDLWGPLILCLALAITLSGKAPHDQAVPIFTGVFTIVWIGAAVVTLNAKLLGGAVSFFQSVCVIGYCLFPLVLASVISIFVKLVWVRIPMALVTFAWSTYASVGFLSESQVHLNNRRALAVYPLCLFYFSISWLVLTS
ncbi:Yip1 domain-containing protein [Phycomyces nitens]|nr:Yip1 domain-containing protein [Phycomyces nitens]